MGFSRCHPLDYAGNHLCHDGRPRRICWIDPQRGCRPTDLRNPGGISNGIRLVLRLTDFRKARRPDSPNEATSLLPIQVREAESRDISLFKSNSHCL